MLLLFAAMLGLGSCRSLDCGCPMTELQEQQLPFTPEDQFNRISSSFSS